MANYQQVTTRNKQRETNARKRIIAAQLGVRVTQLKRLDNGEYIADVSPTERRATKQPREPKVKSAKRLGKRTKRAKKIKGAKNTPINVGRARNRNESDKNAAQKITETIHAFSINLLSQILEPTYVAKIASPEDSKLAVLLSETLLEVLRRRRG